MNQMQAHLIRLAHTQGSFRASDVRGDTGRDPSSEIESLQANGLLDFQVLNGNKSWSLTEKGQELVQENPQLVSDDDWS